MTGPEPGHNATRTSIHLFSGSGVALRQPLEFGHFSQSRWRAESPQCDSPGWSEHREQRPGKRPVSLFARPEGPQPSFPTNVCGKSFCRWTRRYSPLHDELYHTYSRPFHVVFSTIYKGSKSAC